MKILFDGEVRCERDAARGRMALHGRVRAGGDGSLCELDVLFQGTDLPALPDRLSGVELTELGSPRQAPRRFELVGAGLRFQFSAHAMQSHRVAGAAMFAAVPPTPVPWPMRVGWSLLLSVLSIPGAARLLGQRGAS